MKKKLKISDETRTKLRNFIDSCVDFDGLEYVGPKKNTIEEAAKQMFNECVRYDKSSKLLSEKFTEVLQGLPSYISVPFANYEISNLMQSIGLKFDKDEDDEYFETCDLYWKECGIYLAEVFNN